MVMRVSATFARAIPCLIVALGAAGCVAILETDRQQLLVDSVSLLRGSENGVAPAVVVRYWRPSCTTNPQVTVVHTERVMLVQAFAERESSCLFASSALESHRAPMTGLPRGPMTVRVLQPNGETEVRTLTIGPDE